MARPFGRGSSSNNNRIRIRFQSGGSCRRISRLSIKRSNTKCKKTRKVTQQGTVPIIINSKKICKQKSKSVTRKKGERMSESQHHHSSRRLGLRAAATAASTRGSGGREIVEVQGGHIMRSIGRKDRHSKVCTAKGPRDRRVRLSAPTAIQFYDVQDRLGYDRPSKAVDWLINKAKAAIDELAYSSAWTPTTTTTTTSSSLKQGHEEEDMLHFQHKTEPAASGFGFQQQQQQMNNPSQSSSGFLPPSLDSDAISDTIKSFFPMGGGATSSSYSIHFQNYPPDLTRTSSSQAQAQDLRLSLHQSFPDPNLLQQQEPHHHPQPTPSVEQALFSAWSEQQQTGTDTQYQRTVAWNAGTNTSSSSSGGDERGGGFMNQFFSQRGPLQSNNSPWMDQQIPAASDHLMIGFASGGFSGFQIPARIQGEEEHDKPPSSSASRH